MKYTRDKLIEQIDTGHEIDYIFFWGHRPSKDGSVTKSCFSQWWPSAFVFEDVTYKTAEHWMMAMKAKSFKDYETMEKILDEENPKDVKDLGRTVKNFDPKVWSEISYITVVNGNVLKFDQNPELRDFLLSTGDKVLVEASPVDTIWGIGLDEKSSKAASPKLWNGSNLLGFALMETRDIIRG